MELTTIESTGIASATSSPQPSLAPSVALPITKLVPGAKGDSSFGPVEPSKSSVTTGVPSLAGIVIQGAQRACELEPTVRQQCVRSSHAPAPSAVGLARPINWEDEEVSIPGAEVWQELVRMLVAREAAKLMHPAGRARA